MQCIAEQCQLAHSPTSPVVSTYRSISPPTLCRWAIGPSELIKGVILTNQWVQFSVCTPAQQAVAACLERADEEYEGFPTYYDWLRAQYTRKKDILMAGLTASGTTTMHLLARVNVCVWACACACVKLCGYSLCPAHKCVLSLLPSEVLRHSLT